jgi:nucleoside-diphosphate-sugar epimerase
MRTRRAIERASNTVEEAQSVRTVRDVVVNGATGYIGRALIEALSQRGHRLRAVARPASASRVLAGVETIAGDPLAADFLSSALRPCDTLVHLIGTPHPNPGKAAQFLSVDLVSAQAAVSAAQRSRIAHLVYVSVAQPAPVMQAYLAARAEAERLIASAALSATILRPWYVLGPGHRWPVVLAPFYALASLVPRWRDDANRLGLVTLEQMVAALVWSIENPPLAGSQRVIDVPAIRSGGRAPPTQ